MYEKINGLYGSLKYICMFNICDSENGLMFKRGTIYPGDDIIGYIENHESPDVYDTATFSDYFKMIVNRSSVEAIAVYNESAILDLLFAGVLKDPASEDDVRATNVGASDYSRKSILQPWSIWHLWKNELTTWDFDIIKRLYRNKLGESKILDYEKIIHICKERIRELKTKSTYEY